MPTPLSVLLLEDNEDDAILIERALTRQVPYATFVLARTKTEYLARLTSGEMHVVVSDSGVPGCEGLEAFHLARAHDPRLPFIYVSGADDPGRDVQGLKALGISDFLSKDHLHLLGPVIESAVRGRDRSDR